MNLFNIEEYRNMTAPELLKKYNIVIYEADDVAKLNKALSIIKKVIEKYGQRLQN